MERGEILKISIMSFCTFFIIMQVVVMFIQVFTGANIVATLFWTIIGLTILLIGFVGAYKEDKSFLLVYFILTTICLVCLTFVFIGLAMFQGETEESMKTIMSTYGSKPESKKYWDTIQTSMKCCGVKSYKDWDTKIPDSCCRQESAGKLYDCKSDMTAKTMFMDGCYTKMKRYAVATGFFCFITILLLVSQVICSWLLREKL